MFIDFSLIGHFMKLCFKFTNDLEELCELSISLWTLIFWISCWHCFLCSFLIITVSLVYIVYCKTLTSCLSCALFTVVHIFIFNTDEELCWFCWMTFIWAEISFRILQSCPWMIGFDHGSLSSWRSGRANHGFSGVVDSIRRSK